MVMNGAPYLNIYIVLHSPGFVAGIINTCDFPTNDMPKISVVKKTDLVR